MCISILVGEDLSAFVDPLRFSGGRSATVCGVSAGVLQALSARSAMARRLCFSLAVVMQLSLLYLRFTPLGGGDPRAVIHYVMQASHRQNLASSA